MIDAKTELRAALLAVLEAAHARTFAGKAAVFPPVVREVAAFAFRWIARSDAAYHDVEHTLYVTALGADLLEARHLLQDDVTPSAWTHVIVALLLHDIGFVRGVCPGDTEHVFVTGVGDGTLTLSRCATDAALRAVHVDRGLRVASHLLGDRPDLSMATLHEHLEFTRFPVPDDPRFADTTGFSALCRAADLLGQLSDPHYLSKLPALYQEMEENGLHEVQGLTCATDLRDTYPDFFAEHVAPYVSEALDALRGTERGRAWLDSLARNVETSVWDGAADSEG